MEKRDTARVACRPATLCGKFNRATVCGEGCGNGFLDTGSIPVGSTIWSNNLYIFTFRGYSSAGRALEWHSRGQRFDPAYLHQNFRAPRGNSHRILFLIRACSSVGRALRSQRRGHGFESHQVHHEKGTCASKCLFQQNPPDGRVLFHNARQRIISHFLAGEEIFHIRRQPDISLKLPRRNISHKAAADNRL